MKFSSLLAIGAVAANAEIEERLEDILAEQEFGEKLDQILARSDLLDKKAALLDQL